ncbi:unnamed protein product [Musa banksii]
MMGTLKLKQGNANIKLRAGIDMTSKASEEARAWLGGFLILHVLIVSLAFCANSLSELAACIPLPELPVRWSDVDRLHRFVVACRHLERKALPHHLWPETELPPLSPRPRHRHPGGVGSPHRQLRHVAGAGHVVHQHRDPEGVPPELESDVALPDARYSPELHGDTARIGCLGDLHVHGHGEVEVLLGRVAQADGCRRAEAGRRHDGAPLLAPVGSRCALQLEACTAFFPIVEQHRAQRRVRQPVSVLEEIVIPTSSACTSTKHMRL